MRNLRSLALFAAAALPLAGCFSLFPMPGTGGKKSAPAKAEVDGKVFGTGTMVQDAWEVTLLVDPSTVAVSATADQLIIDSTKGGAVDPIYGDFSLTMRRKRPGETAKTLIAEELRNLGNLMRQTSYCGLGTTAANHIRDILDKFPDTFNRRLRGPDYTCLLYTSPSPRD